MSLKNRFGKTRCSAMQGILEQPERLFSFVDVEGHPFLSCILYTKGIKLGVRIWYPTDIFEVQSVYRHTIRCNKISKFLPKLEDSSREEMSSVWTGNQNQIDNNPQGGMRGCLNSCLGAMGAIMCCRMMDDCFTPMGGFDEFGNPTSMEETDFGQDAFDIDF
ncbi:hypothetical protein TNCV_1463611 [Trichonephila clavipes]|nr:hypothetical protein TNCV_1463611 [Trichonephila clavipes]